MDLKFSFKSFAVLNPFELYAYMQLRSEVFVVEQNCVYQDLDDELVACARIVPAGLAYPEISIGRVIVAEAYRKQQLGHELLRYCNAQIEKHYGPQPIVLSAQAHLQDFYKKHNFVPDGAIYLEDGIPHIHMIKQ
jgi:ElaA protein